MLKISKESLTHGKATKRRYESLVLGDTVGVSTNNTPTMKARKTFSFPIVGLQ
jgi:hypothetical protein